MKYQNDNFRFVSKLAEFLGDTPRVKLLEALISLGPIEFSRADLARQAKMWPMTVNRVFDQLVEQNLVFQVTGGKHPQYRANELSARLWLLAKTKAGLSIIEREGVDSVDSATTQEARRRALSRIVAPLSLTVDEVVSGFLALPEARGRRPLLLSASANSGGPVYDVSFQAVEGQPVPVTLTWDATVVDAPVAEL